MLSDPGKEVPMADQAIGARPLERRGRQWLRVLVGGLLLWVATVVVTFATANTNLVPTIILLGSFLVPVTFVVYAFQHYADQVVTAQRIFTAFVYGGALGVLGASVLEAAFLRQPSGLTYVGVGLIEEAVKLAALWLLALRLPRYSMRDGMVLGATVGLGFAALESAGYAFNALFTQDGGLSLVNLVETEVLRGLLTPVGHGLWTAILGGVLFRTAARTGRPRLTGALVGLVCGGGGVACVVGRRPAGGGVADPAVHRHPGAVGGDPDGPRPGRHPGPGPHLHHAHLGAAAARRAARGGDPAWPLAAGAGPGARAAGPRTHPLTPGHHPDAWPRDLALAQVPECPLSL
jgi:RsiW-degrading membrane proteinase PrsW (M82 family)